MIDLARWESTRRQTQAATVGVIAFALASIALTPIAGQKLAPSLTIFAIFMTAAIGANGMTAFLLLSQYRTTRAPAIAILSLAYGFAAMTIIPYTVTYPGMFGLGVPLGAGPQSSGWIWVLWHVGFIGLLLAYVIARRHDEKRGMLIQGSQVTRGIRVATAAGDDRAPSRECGQLPVARGFGIWRDHLDTRLQ